MAVVAITKARRDQVRQELIDRYLRLKELLNSAKGDQDEVEIDTLDFQFALADFETILKQIKGLK